MKGKIETAILENNMQLAYEKIIIGFSGGADSSALLHFFKDKAKKVVCVHINHMIRGAEADRDEQFCRNVCQKHGIEFVSYKIDVPALARQQGKGIEQTAREQRYQVFYNELDKRNFDVILTAHNANDNTESIIFNLARGSGANGASGIKAVNGKVLRPLILATREEILDYCLQNKIEYVNDSTNDSTEYTRNYIRHEIIPMLEKLNPSLHIAFSRLSTALRTDEDFITAEAERFISERCENGKIYVDRLEKCHDSVKIRVLKLLSGENLDYKSIKACLDFIPNSKSGAVINLCKGVSLKRERDYVGFVRTTELECVEFEKKLEAGLNEIEGLGITIAYNCTDIPRNKALYLTLEILADEPIVARSKRDGDTIRHKGMTKKVKKLMCERRIPSHLRDKIPIICDKNGIVAIPDVAVRDGAKGNENNIILRFYK